MKMMVTLDFLNEHEIHDTLFFQLDMPRVPQISETLMFEDAPGENTLPPLRMFVADIETFFYLESEPVVTMVSAHVVEQSTDPVEKNRLIMLLDRYDIVTIHEGDRATEGPAKETVT